MMNAIASLRLFKGASKSNGRPPEIWLVAFCRATLMSGSLTPALASLSTVMTASLSLGSIQKKSVPMVVDSLALVTLAFGKARNWRRSGVFSPMVCHTG